MVAMFVRVAQSLLDQQLRDAFSLLLRRRNGVLKVQNFVWELGVGEICLRAGVCKKRFELKKWEF